MSEMSVALQHRKAARILFCLGSTAVRRAKFSGWKCNSTTYHSLVKRSVLHSQRVCIAQQLVGSHMAPERGRGKPALNAGIRRGSDSRNYGAEVSVTTHTE